LLRASLPNPDGALRPGQFVRVRLLGAARPGAILVPQQSVLQGAKGHFLILVDKGGLAQLRNVEVGPWLGDDWVINAGLQPGDVVVTDGMARLSPGAAVKIVEPRAAAAPQAASSAAPAASK
jgi:membrane fusion protein (multidrug efflux system)